MPAYAGIATFCGVPLCLNQEDLRAGKVDVAIVGAPVDTSPGPSGAAYGPRALRADERLLPNMPELLTNPSTRIRPFEHLTVVDYGDAAVDPLSIENSMQPIRTLVREIAEVGRSRSCSAATTPSSGPTPPRWPMCTAAATSG